MLRQRIFWIFWSKHCINDRLLLLEYVVFSSLNRLILLCIILESILSDTSINLFELRRRLTWWRRSWLASRRDRHFCSINLDLLERRHSNRKRDRVENRRTQRLTFETRIFWTLWRLLLSLSQFWLVSELESEHSEQKDWTWRELFLECSVEIE